jgi:hypothetical protein
VLGKWFWSFFFIFAMGIPFLASVQEGIILKEEEAPKAVFPEANSFEGTVIRTNEELKAKIQQRMGNPKLHSGKRPT